MSGFPLQQIVVEVCMDIVYMITGGRSWQKFHDLVCRKLQKQQRLTTSLWLLHLFISCLPIFPISVPSLMCLSLLQLCHWGENGVQSDVEYGYSASTTAGKVFNRLQHPARRRFCLCWSQCGFGHPSYNSFYAWEAFQWTHVESSCWCLYCVVALCYFPVALIGYWTFGNEVQDTFSSH